MAPYPGRLADQDLGRGHSCSWSDGGRTLTVRHWYGPCGGWHGFDVRLAGTGMLAAGGPAAPGLLTVAARLECPLCDTAGWIQGGRWVPA